MFFMILFLNTIMFAGCYKKNKERLQKNRDEWYQDISEEDKKQ